MRSDRNEWVLTFTQHQLQFQGAERKGTPRATAISGVTGSPVKQIVKNSECSAGRWNKVVSEVGDMSRSGHRTDKGADTVELCGRGSWWLETLKDTPVPGAYRIRDFLEEAELNPVRKTYGFKGVGRKTETMGVHKGDMLLPGAYEYTDSTQQVLMHQAFYSFKNCPRPDNFTLGIRDKHINTSPCDYSVTAKPVEKIPCKHVMFRSTVQRISFLPKEGPAPCRYSPQTKPDKGITSCFKSTLPRLHTVHSNTPGPGAYDPCRKSFAQRGQGPLF